MQGYSPKLPLSVDNTDGLYGMNKTALESVKQDLKMLLLTNPGERMMLPDYGVGLRRFLFEQDTEDLKSALRSSINEQVSKYMNFVVIDDIGIYSSDLDDNSLTVSITYSVPSLRTKEELNLSFGSN